MSSPAASAPTCSWPCSPITACTCCANAWPRRASAPVGRRSAASSPAGSASARGRRPLDPVPPGLPPRRQSRRTGPGQRPDAGPASHAHQPRGGCQPSSTQFGSPRQILSPKSASFHFNHLKKYDEVGLGSNRLDNFPRYDGKRESG